MSRPLVDINGRPIRPVLAPSPPTMPVFAYVAEDCTILLVVTPFKSAEFAVLGTNTEEIRFICGINVAIPFQAFPMTNPPAPGFYVWTFNFKATEKPSITNTSRPDIAFFTKSIRPATMEDFKSNGFSLPDFEVSITQSITDETTKSSVQL